MTRELIAQAEALEEAAEMVADWGGYASEYFQQKHDLAGDVAKLQAKADALRAQAEQPAAPVASAPPADYDWTPEARQLAAQCWCDPETSKTQMDVVLAEAVARRIAAWMWTGAFHARNEEYWRDRALNAERQPNPRIAALTGLLREAHKYVQELPLGERIEAALGGLK